MEPHRALLLVLGPLVLALGTTGATAEQRRVVTVKAGEEVARLDE
jgi:hypothetical protein